MTATGRARSASPHRRQDGVGRPAEAVALVTALLLGLPIVALIARSLLDGSLVGTVGMQVVLDALALSLVTTTVTMVLMVVMGTPLALVLARKRFRGAVLVETIVDLPIVLPPAVAGLALLLVFGRRGLLGGALSAFGIELPFTTAAVVIAQLFVAAPFYIRSARTGFAGVDRDLEDAARVDGASENQLFRTITVPLAGTALAAGLVMSWARALGEFGATIMFAGNIQGETQTLPLAVYGEFQAGNLEVSIAAASVLVLAALGVLVAVRLLHWGRALDTRSIAG
jgi:molybdate transport system permease protein